MKKLNVGIIGYGVGKHHANAYKSTKKCNIKIFDKSRLKKKQILKDNFIAINSEEEFFKNKFDAISIASHDKFHYQHIVKSSKLTKNILCEKPICNNFNELTKLYKIVRSKKIKLECNFVLRAVDLFIDIKNKIKSNYFGEIFFIEGSYLWSRIHKLSGWRVLDKEYTFIKGASIHMIDLICWLIEDKPIYVYAVGNSLGNKERYKKDTSITLILEFKNKLYAQVNALGPTIYPHYHELKIFGSNSTSINQFKNNFFINKKNNNKTIKNKNKYPDHKNKKI